MSALPDIESALQAFSLVFMLLNPFLLIIYLLEPLEELDKRGFSSALRRAGAISGVVFVVFAVVGDAVFSTVLNARFESFQVFGGIIFLVIGVRFVFYGNKALLHLRGAPEQVAGAVAMPIMIGPATISASIIAGQQLGVIWGPVIVVLAVFASVFVMILLKALHDFVRPRNEKLVERYVDIAGRVLALVVGTFSIEMIMRGVTNWLGIS